jgi:hypothetical protein
MGYELAALNPKDAEDMLDELIEVTQRDGVTADTGAGIYKTFCGRMRDPRLPPQVQRWKAPPQLSPMMVESFCPQCGVRTETACTPWQAARFRGSSTHHCDTMRMAVSTSLDYIMCCTGDRLEAHFWLDPDAS